jgi:GntR family transcriptional repressor for pyruvate dehydrogenase complex
MAIEQRRIPLEGTVASLAAERVTKSDIKTLKKLQKEAQTYYEKGLSQWDNFVKVDERIHMALARISNNPIYQFIVETIHANIQRYYDKFLSAGDNEFEENFRDLQQLVDAVCNKQASEAGSLATEHVRKFSRYMERKSKQSEPLKS